MGNKQNSNKFQLELIHLFNEQFLLQILEELYNTTTIQGLFKDDLITINIVSKSHIITKNIDNISIKSKRITKTLYKDDLNCVLMDENGQIRMHLKRCIPVPQNKFYSTEFYSGDEIIYSSKNDIIIIDTIQMELLDVIPYQRITYFEYSDAIMYMDYYGYRLICLNSLSKIIHIKLDFRFYYPIYVVAKDEFIIIVYKNDIDIYDLNGVYLYRIDINSVGDYNFHLEQ